MALATNSAMEIPRVPQQDTHVGTRGSRQAALDAAARLLPSQSQTFGDVDIWLNLFETRPGIRTQRAEELRSMIESFHSFSRQYIDKLSELLETTPRIWLENAVDNVLLDYWEPVLRAAEQNRSPHYRDLLEKGYAKLAVLQQNLESRLKHKFKINIVLYFERIGKAKRMPFGNTYLIGIPLIDAYRDDWMAIPHELGHHIFWNARFSGTDQTITPIPGTNFLAPELGLTMQSMPFDLQDPARAVIERTLNDWTEEIFADVVGARIAGEEFLNKTWDRVQRKAEKKEDLFASDGEHPVTYLLPYLRAAAAQLPFQERWKEFYGDIEFTTLVSSKPVGEQDPTIRIEHLRQAVESYAENITAKLQGLEIDRLIEGPANVDELVKYIIKMKQASNVNQSIDGHEILRLLLKPMILEKGESWICKNGHTNSSDRNFCQICGLAHSIWSFLPHL